MSGVSVRAWSFFFFSCPSLNFQRVVHFNTVSSPLSPDPRHMLLSENCTLGHEHHTDSLLKLMKVSSVDRMFIFSLLAAKQDS